MEDGRFRSDLYFRINVVGIHVPPLRARGGDVLLLAQHVVALYARREGKQVSGLSPAAAERLVNYSWQGNVRELQNCMERRVEDLPERIRGYL